MANADQDADERSMRLLQPKLVVLYLIAKKGKVKNNISELSRLLHYEKDSWTHNMVHNLRDGGFIEPKVIDGVEYLILTKAGKRKIAPVTLSRYYLPLVIMVLALVPVSWGYEELVGIPVTAIPLVVSGVIMFGVAIFLFYEMGKLENDYFGLE